MFPLGLLGLSILIACIAIFALPKDAERRWSNLLYAIAVICFLLWLYLFFFTSGDFSYHYFRR